MKLIIAIINPHKLDDVRNGLIEIGVEGATVTLVKGYGRQKGHTEIYRGAEYTIEFMAKIKFEILILDEQLDLVIKVISDKAKSGKVGDGKIFVINQDEIIRIRTGETGVNAI
jgi:nitrogen regulatory protein P-II 2